MLKIQSFNLFIQFFFIHFRNLRVLFNSLGANASVNHLHWHLYFLNHRMLLETVVIYNSKTLLFKKTFKK